MVGSNQNKCIELQLRVDNNYIFQANQLGPKETLLPNLEEQKINPSPIFIFLLVNKEKTAFLNPWAYFLN